MCPPRTCSEPVRAHSGQPEVLPLGGRIVHERVLVSRFVNRFLLIGFAVLGVGALYACVATGPGQRDMCRTQLREYVAQRFDHTVIGIRLTYAEPSRRLGGIGMGNAVVSVEECDGYHWFDLFGTYNDCEVRTYFGNPPNLIRYRNSAEGCESG